MNLKMVIQLANIRSILFMIVTLDLDAKSAVVTGYDEFILPQRYAIATRTIIVECMDRHLKEI